MRASSHIVHRAAARDDGIRRLRRVTALLAVGAGALAVGVADLAARALPGHTTKPAAQPAPKRTARAPRPTPPQLVPVAQAAPAPPASAPVQSSAPPVATSGGT